MAQRESRCSRLSRLFPPSPFPIDPRRGMAWPSTSSGWANRCEPDPIQSPRELSAMEGKNILKMVQSKLSEKEEIIHVQQGQIQELTESLEEKNEVIVELMRQIDDLTEKVNSGGANATGTQENEEVIREQMQQIFELSEKVERLEADLARATEHQAEFESLQKQLKEMLGES